MPQEGKPDGRSNEPPDYERFVQLFAKIHDDLFAHIFALLPHWSDAEDVFQKTSLVLWRKFDEFEPGSNFLAWACKVAFFEVRNFRRVSSRDRLRFNDALLEQLAVEREVRPALGSLQHELLAECLSKLSDDQRELLCRAYEGETTIRQLAGELFRSPQTIYNRLNFIRRTLFECIEAASQRRKTQS
jgi:RNA polymerase sigma-70 factor, ECF subfamily